MLDIDLRFSLGQLYMLVLHEMIRHVACFQPNDDCRSVESTEGRRSDFS